MLRVYRHEPTGLGAWRDHVLDEFRPLADVAAAAGDGFESPGLELSRAGEDRLALREPPDAVDAAARWLAVLAPLCAVPRPAQPWRSGTTVAVERRPRWSSRG